MVHLYRIKPLHEALILCLKLLHAHCLSLQEVEAEFKFTVGQYLVTVVADTSNEVPSASVTKNRLMINVCQNLSPSWYS